MQGAATMQDTSHNTHNTQHASYITCVCVRVLNLSLVGFCVFYNPVCRTLHSTGGEGKMLMMMMMMMMMMMCVCVCVDIACVFYTSSSDVPSVIEGDQPYEGGPPLAERNWDIYMLYKSYMICNIFYALYDIYAIYIC